MFGNGKADVWIYDLDRDSMMRLTSASAPGASRYLVWTPDGKRIAFSTSSGIFWMRADGAGDAQRLTESSNLQTPASFSPDGRRLAFTQFGSPTSPDIWTLPIEFGDSDNPKPGKPELFLRTGAVPEFSPDGRWLVYVSSNSGRLEVYVRPFPGPGGKWQISNGGGIFPMWSPKGRELFYRSTDSRIMVAAYTSKADSFLADKPRPWSEGRFPDSGIGLIPDLDIAPDGKRFAILMPTDTANDQKPPTQMIFLFNFFDELRRRVPVR